AWGVFVALVLFIGFLATWALIPSTALEATWRTEQEQMAAMAGAEANQWVLLESANVRADTAASARTSAASLTNSRFDQWLLDRIYATLLWVAVITYRAQALLMWSLIGIPLILAASVDGFYVREIRKMAFTSQSPIRHKIGIHAFKVVSLAMVAWLCLPIPMPIVVAPAVVCFVAVSLWLWVANLQKRL
ncbi:MAG: DUF4400 domain-containing protein, partial [Rhodocyclaceae bacterium]|nr:DUF4400 domain-containing protein [Rhodocyclaceae bacterium]